MYERLFFIVSGEHPSLPYAEVKAILEAYGIGFKVIDTAYKLMRVEAPLQALSAVDSRSLMCEQSGLELYACRASLEEILAHARLLDLSKYDLDGGSFMVRVRKLGELKSDIGARYLERQLGALVLERCRRATVDLEHPDNFLLGAISGDRFLLGLVRHERPRGIIKPRKPRSRPAFHPSTMPPKLARCMVNLARPRPGGLLVDPFSGIGGILLEAGLIGCRVLGCDVLEKMVRGARMNLRHYGVESEGLILCDARKLPITYADAIVADPPYGRGASTMGSTTLKIVEEFLPVAYDVLRKGAHICLATPAGTPVEDMGASVGFSFIENHLLRVHRSLARKITVLRKD